MKFPSEPRERNRLIFLRNILIFGLSFIIFAAAVFFLFYLASLPSAKQKKEYQQREEVKEKLKKMVDCFVLEAGWQKRQAGKEELYVPQIKILLINKSSGSLKDIIIRANFEVEGERLCFDSVPIFKLDPETYSEFILNCAENLGFGILYKGLSLLQMTKKVSYEIGLTANNLYIPLTHGILEFQLIPPWR